MEKAQIWTLGGLGLMLVVALSVFVITPGLFQVATPPVGEGISMTYHSAVCPYVTRADGTREDLGCVHNVVTNGGKDMIREDLAAGGSNKPTNLSLGNGTAIAAASTTIDREWLDCGMVQKAATYGINSGNGNWSLWATWTSTCDGVIVNNTALYNATTPKVFAGAGFTSTTLQTNDQITVNYTISIS